MGKCDIIIPVYKSPEWLCLCVYSVFMNTKDEYLNKVFLINDCDDELTANCINNLCERYGEKVVVLQNEKNLGFIASVNRGLKASAADHVLLLNTDCILSNRVVEKMINNIKDDSSIGMICPISSNAANLTLEMFEGFNYSDMNSLLESKFPGKIFDACTVTGNCLLITRECIEKTGFLDLAYGLGYGEETDYQFRAMSKGFKAKVSIDTYVFHKAEVSFGTSTEKHKRLAQNRDLFFSRWGHEYKKEMDKYERNDPIKFIKDNLTEEDKIPQIDTAIYLPAISQNAGGVHTVVDIVNYLAICGKRINLFYDIMYDYKEIMLFNPWPSDKLENIGIKNIVATIWSSVFKAKEIAKKKKSKLLYFVQGYECLFENGGVYGIVETGFKLVDSIFTISSFLHDEIKENFGLESTTISNGINLDLIAFEKRTADIKSVTMVLRNSPMKGDWLLLDLIRKIDLKYSGLKINLVYMNEYIEFPQLRNIKLIGHLGPLSRIEMIRLLRNSDVYIDASLNEGFGLTPLEAAASGNAVIVSNSFGVNDYIKNGENGFIINEVNNPKKYIEKLDFLLNNPKEFQKISNNAVSTSRGFDLHASVDKYIEYFNEPKLINKNIEITECDNRIIDTMTRSPSVKSKNTKILHFVAKITPVGFKKKLKSFVAFLYNNYSH